MQEIIIDEEFKHLMPMLDIKTFRALEENILENGCRDALVLWDGILIDGHNRYTICTKHDIPFNTVSKEFSSREDVLLWIISTQLSRRNLTSIQLSHFRGLHYRMEKKLAGNNKSTNQYNVQRTQNGDVAQWQRTSAKLAEQYRVSPNTITRDAKTSEAIEAIGEISPKAKRLILSGEVRVEKKALEDLASASRSELAEIAGKIEAGTYAYERMKTGSEQGDSPRASTATANPPQKSKLTKTPEELKSLVVSSTAGEPYSKLVEATRTGDTKEVKEALKTYINSLVELYKMF